MLWRYTPVLTNRDQLRSLRRWCLLKTPRGLCCRKALACSDPIGHKTPDSCWVLLSYCCVLRVLRSSCTSICWQGVYSGIQQRPEKANLRKETLSQFHLNSGLITYHSSGDREYTPPPCSFGSLSPGLYDTSAAFQQNIRNIKGCDTLWHTHS